MVVKDWKLTAVEGAIKNGPWFCLYLILTGCLGYGFIEFGRIAGESVKAYISQAREDNATTLLAVKANGDQIKETLALMVSAKAMMQEAPAERRAQTALLREMVDSQKATAEELRAFRKNALTPQTP